MTRCVNVLGGKIFYELSHKSVKNLNLRINSDGKIKVSVPNRVGVKTADEFVRKNESFIFSALEKLKTTSVISRNEITFIYFLGARFDVKTVLHTEGSVITEGKIKNFTEFTDDGLVIHINENSFQSEEERYFLLKALIEAWRKEEGKRLFPQILKKVYPRFAEKGFYIPFPSLTVKNMKSRWGSCTASKKKICLNSALIEKPVVCIEYIISHELSHLIEQNHSKRFYSVLDSVFSDRKAVNKLLNS